MNKNIFSLLLAMLKRLILTFLNFEIFEIFISKFFFKFRNSNISKISFFEIILRNPKISKYLFRNYFLNFEIKISKFLGFVIQCWPWICDARQVMGHPMTVQDIPWPPMTSYDIAWLWQPPAMTFPPLNGLSIYCPWLCIRISKIGF